MSANDIADALGRPRPSLQQAAVIEAPLAPALVVAGAGSGKTETMANRVLWLLANGHVRSGEVLGLTFTRKAAGELAERIRDRIDQLMLAGLVPGAEPGAEAPDGLLDAPVVATYNAFANSIYRDNALLIGREGDGAVLGEASAWQLARSIVVRSTDERLPALGRSVDQVTKAVLGLSRAMAENIVDREQLLAFAERFGAVAELPPGGRGAYADVAEMASTVGALPLLTDLAGEYAAAKLRKGFVEYSDQVALGLEILRRAPQLREQLRERHRVVLLDEYQDTSVVQSWLLAELFAGHPVMAVGDPNQSIYGWRGASAGNLDEFSGRFAEGGAAVFSLSTSWRNGHRILEAANTIAAPLAAHGRVPVERLGPGPFATARPVEAIVRETIDEEADAAALWLKERLEAPPGQPVPSAAILFRARATQDRFIAALRRHGVPHHVLGIGGLLAEPEIAELVSALAVVHDPGAGSELVRLLASSRWRLGVRDLRALRGVAGWLRDRDYAHRPLEDGLREAMRASVADGEGGSIVDALDFVATARPGHGALAAFSDLGLERLRDAGRAIARLRARSGLDLVDFVTVVEQELQLDIEVAANESRALGVAPMEALLDALSDYLAVDDAASLGGFLAWLREAEWRDGLAPRSEEPEPGTVQLLTVHGSKGLEWDHVVVPRMVHDELPAKPRDSTGWLGFGALPWPFRGDAAELPEFEWQGATTRKELIERKADFSAAVRARHEREERRLGYVAVTRARHSLLLTGSFWSSQATPRPPSVLLRELEAAGVVPALPESSEFEANPLGDEQLGFLWPRDPLGGRRAALEAAAERVRAASARLAADGSPADAGQWARDLELLLEERRRRLDSGDAVAVPQRVPASRFKDYVTDAAAVAEALRRPMPQRPYRATRLGTLFHQWVEARYGLHGTAETIDSGEADLDLDVGDGAEIDEGRLDTLRATFERSPWAARRPIEVEREIHLPFDGRVIVCKIDAVFREGERFQLVDWKTGAAPRDARDLEEKQLQLALYRLAYARWAGIDESLIDAVFYFVADDAVITPARLFDEAELLERWRAAVGAGRIA